MSNSRKKEERKRRGKAAEKKFFKIAAIFTVVLRLVAYSAQGVDTTH